MIGKQPLLWTAGGLGLFAAMMIGDTVNAPDLSNATDYELANLKAFQSVLGEGEGGREGYNSLVGGGRFDDFTDHPAITGEFAGIQGAHGLTTAAGRYQITRTTWLDIAGRHRWGSFDPVAQDNASVFLLQRRGALPAVLQGRANDAARMLRDEWEMFTQAQWNPDAVQARFEQLGGINASDL